MLSYEDVFVGDLVKFRLYLYKNQSRASGYIKYFIGIVVGKIIFKWKSNEFGETKTPCVKIWFNNEIRELVFGENSWYDFQRL